MPCSVWTASVSPRVGRSCRVSVISFWCVRMVGTHQPSIAGLRRPPPLREGRPYTPIDGVIRPVSVRWHTFELRSVFIIMRRKHEWTEPDAKSDANDRLSEIAEILAAGLMRV